MELCGEQYDGPTRNGRMEGDECTFTFANGNRYVGSMVDGEFHGEGTLHFAQGGRYTAVWVKGRATEGAYTFAPEEALPEGVDGLPYAEQNWEYCTGQDRRFYTEHVLGIPPAGESQFQNLPGEQEAPPEPPPQVVEGPMHQWIVNVSVAMTDDIRSDIVGAIKSQLGPYVKYDDHPNAYLVITSSEGAERARQIVVVDKVTEYDARRRIKMIDIGGLEDIHNLDVEVNFAEKAVNWATVWSSPAGQQRGIIVALAVAKRRVLVQTRGKNVHQVVSWLGEQLAVHTIQTAQRV